MVRCKIGGLPQGYIAALGGVLASAVVYAGGFVYAGTLDDPRSFTGTARVALLAATALLGAGVIQLVRAQQRDTAAIRDAYLLGGALAALSWVALVRPGLGGTDTDLALTLLRAVFALADVAVCVGLVLLAIPNAGRHLRRVRVAGMVQVAVNTLFVLTGFDSTFSFGSPLIVGYAGFYVVLAGVAVREISARRESPEVAPVGPATRAQLRSVRVGVLSTVPVVSGLAVAVAVASEPRGGALAVASLAAALTTLTAVRLRDVHSADSKLVDELRDQCDELASRHAEVTAECKRALASLKDASDFLADMTERVASPLNGVLEAGDELRAAGPPGTQPAVDKLVQSSDTLLFIVNDLLGIAEASAPPVLAAPETFDPAGLVTQTGESFVDAAAARGLDLVVAADDNVPELVSGPRGHVEKLLRIFIDNAVQFSSKGEIELTTTFIDRTVDGVVVRFAVHDGGIGMTREHRLALLAAPLEAEAAPRRYRTKPHGLALVPALTEQLGGTWGVESELGRGSTFWFSAVLSPEAAPLPQLVASPLLEPACQIDPPAVETADELVEGAPEREPEPAMRLSGRVLLVDDNPLNRRVTLIALQTAGFRVEVATNGLEAVDAVTTNAYDVVLMDCEMPVLDGFEATVEIRSREGGSRHTPIIALTAHSTHDDQLRAAAAGMDDFIAKPFETRDILRKLARWVPQHAA